MLASAKGSPPSASTSLKVQSNASRSRPTVGSGRQKIGRGHLEIGRWTKIMLYNGVYRGSTYVIFNMLITLTVYRPLPSVQAARG